MPRANKKTKYAPTSKRPWSTKPTSTRKLEKILTLMNEGQSMKAAAKKVGVNYWVAVRRVPKLREQMSRLSHPIDERAVPTIPDMPGFASLDPLNALADALMPMVISRIVLQLTKFTNR